MERLEEADAEMRVAHHPGSGGATTFDSRGRTDESSSVLPVRARVAATFLLLLAMTFVPSQLHSQFVLDLPTPSQHAVVEQRVGLTDIRVSYSRPGVKGRQVWGSLVPYGFASPATNGVSAPWRLGANENTTLSVTHPVTIEGRALPAGTYGLFAAMNRDSTATIIVSRESESWGSFSYDSTEDVLRVTLRTRPHPHVELLTFAFDEVGPTHAILAMRWADLELPLRIGVNVDSIVVASVRRQMKMPVTFSHHSRYQAAAYLASANANLDVALQWAKEAVDGVPGPRGFSGVRDFLTLTTLSDVYFLMDSVSQSKVALDGALQHAGDVPLGTAAFYQRSLITSRRIDHAAYVAEWMIRQWPKQWTTYDAMARVHVAQRNYAEAILYESRALEYAGPAVRPTIESRLELLRAGKAFN